MAEDVRGVPIPKDAAFHVSYDAPHCVVLDSAYCSMGRMIALRACERAGRAYYDTDSLLELVSESGVTRKDVEAFEQRLKVADADLDALRQDAEYLRVAKAYDLAAERALAAGPCLIHDRVTKAFVTERGYTCTAVMNYATNVADKRVRAHTSPLYAALTSDAELDVAIAREDAARRGWHTLREPKTAWGEPATYDLMINTDQLGLDFAAELLARVMQGTS